MVLSQVVYLYVHTTVPSHVIGFGFEVEPTKTGTMVLPHASRILAGAPGSTASAGHVTVVDPFGGVVGAPL